MPMTAAQICVDACAIAKCPGYLPLAGRQLNLVLQDLYMKRNLKANLVTNLITVPPYQNGPFNLEANYQRTYDLWYQISGCPYFLDQCTLKQFDAEDLQAGIGGLPYEFATDLSPVPGGNPGLLYIYPQSSNEFVLTHRYFLMQPDIASPQTSNAIPWFVDQDYLMLALAARLMRTTDDDRMPLFLADADKILEPYLIMAADDEQQVVKEVRLDPRRFRIAGSSRPTKLEPF